MGFETQACVVLFFLKNNKKQEWVKAMLKIFALCKNLSK